MKKLKIVTACSRAGWILPIYLNLQIAHANAGLELDWNLIVTPEERKLLDPFQIVNGVNYYVADIEGNDSRAGVKKCNAFVGKNEIEPSTYLWFLSDDNLLPVNVLSAIVKAAKQQPRAEVFVTSHKRGQRNDRHDCHDLVAAPQNLGIGGVSGEQFFYQRRHFKPWSTNSINGDGEFICQLYSEIPDRFHFLPEVWTTFDALKPSRWDREKMLDVVFEKGGVDL